MVPHDESSLRLPPSSINDEVEEQLSPKLSPRIVPWTVVVEVEPTCSAAPSPGAANVSNAKFPARVELLKYTRRDRNLLIEMSP